MANTTHQPPFHIERRPEVLHRSGYSRSVLQSRIKNQLFVPPISLGERCVGWLSSEVDAVLAAYVAGKPKEEIKTIVSNLIKQRQQTMEVLK